MSKHSDLYGEDILLWSERQGDLLRRLAAGESVSDQVDWPHVVDEIEHSHAQRRDSQDEIDRLRAQLAAARHWSKNFVPGSMSWPVSSQTPSMKSLLRRIRWRPRICALWSPDGPSKPSGGRTLNGGRRASWRG